MFVLRFSSSFSSFPHILYVNRSYEINCKINLDSYTSWSLYAKKFTNLTFPFNSTVIPGKFENTANSKCAKVTTLYLKNIKFEIENANLNIFQVFLGKSVKNQKKTHCNMISKVTDTS